MRTIQPVNLFVHRVLRCALVVILLQGISTPIFALTDEEVVSKAVELYDSGMSATNVAKELLKSGATMDQLQKLQSEYASQVGSTKSTSVVAALQATSTNQRINTTIDRDSMHSETIIQPTVTKTIFGHDIFAQAFAKMEPQMNVATPQNYVLGSGDIVNINIYGASQESFQEEINPDGIIVIKDYGPLHIGGMTIAAATRKIKSTLGARYQNSQLMVTLGQSRSISVNVMGEVYFPGSYQLTAFADVLYALYMAGGITETGTLRAVKVYRNSNLISTVDLYQYLMNGATKTNIRLEDGDVVLVGTYSVLVQAQGNVKRPIYYELLSNETIHELIYYAGGFTGDAYTDAVRVYRRNSTEGFATHTVANAQFAQFRMMDGDTLEVEAILDRPQNTLEIQGAVFRPGFYGLSGNLHTVKQLVETAQGIIEQAVPEQAVLYRMKADRTYEAIQINVANILSGATADMELNNEDRIFIPSRQRQLDHFEVVIHGEVYEPGTYPYAEKETVANLILRAGGMTDQASTSKIHIIRHLIDPAATAEAEKNTMLFTIAYDNEASTFVLEPNDEVYVRTTPAYAPAQNVMVRGEVVFDGQYALKTKQDRLSSLIEAAGGLTKYAYAEGAKLVRQMDEEEKLHREQLLKINKSGSSKEYVNENKLDMGDFYYVAINLAAALAHPGGKEDFVLRDGDIIIVPTMTSTIKVLGEVLYPNTVTFTQGKKAKFYIEQAGGYSQLARKSKTYVIYANGAVSRASKASIMPGCEIIVPSKPEKAPITATQWVGIASATASLASVAASLATLIVNATKKSN